MFERFTDRARRAIVLAQEEARALVHNYIGTEHLLLGLAAEPDGLAGKAIASFGVSLDQLREDVLRIIGKGSEHSTSHIPFTPRAKRCLELCLREALMMGHNYIGTEHILLGLLREGEGVAAQILVQRGAHLVDMRARVIELLGSSIAASGGGSSETGGLDRPSPERDRAEMARRYASGETLESIGRDFGVSRERVRVLIEGRIPSEPRVTAEALAEEGTYDPKCPNCRRASLIDTAAYKTIEVPEDGGEGRLRLRVVYCEACGVAITTLIVPDGE